MKINTKTLIFILAGIMIVVGILFTTTGASLLGNFAETGEAPVAATKFVIVHPTNTEDQACSETKEMRFDMTNPSDRPIEISRIGFYFQGEGFQNFSVSDIKLSTFNKKFSYPAETSLQSKSIAYFDLSAQTLTNTGLAPLVIAPKTAKSVFLSWKGSAVVTGSKTTGEFQVAPVYAKYGDTSASEVLENGLQPLETIFIPKQDTWIWTPFQLCL